MNRRLAAVALAATVAIAVAACGSTDGPSVPAGPGVSRAEPTGTVDTTVPATSTTRG